MCRWGRAAPSNPSLFFNVKLPAHKKPILNHTSSPTDLSTKTLQKLSPNGFRVNSNNSRQLQPQPWMGLDEPTGTCDYPGQWGIMLFEQFSLLVKNTACHRT